MGAQTGNLIKTPLQAGIEGAIEGLSTGFDLVSKYQQNQIRQNQIEQLPTQNKNDEAIASINQSKAYILENTQQEALEAEKAKYKQQADDIAYRKEISQTLSNPDPAVRAGVFKDPRYTDLFTRDSKLFEYALGASKNGMPAEEFDALSSSLNLFKQRDYEVAKEKQNSEYLRGQLAKRQKAVDDFQSSSAWSAWTTGMSDSEIRKQFEIAKAGVKQYDPQTNKLTGEPDKVSDDVNFEVFKNGEYVGTVTPAEADRFSRYKNYQTAYDNYTQTGIWGQTPPIEKAKEVQQVEKSAATGSAAQGPGTEGYDNRVKSFSERLNPVNNFIRETPQNQDTTSIVEQKRSQFNELNKNPPEGVASGTLEERMLKKKEAIKSGVVQNTSTPAAKSQQNFDLVSQVSQPANVKGFVNVNFTPSTARTPAESVSQIAKTPVTLAFDTTFKPRVETVNRVQTNPLLQNEPPLIKGLATVESGGVTNAESPTGVRGLFQVTRRTAAMYGLNRDIPEEGKLAAKLYLNDLYDRFDGNIALALAGYNAGPGNIAQAVDDAGTTDWEVVKNFLKPYVSEAKFKEVKNYPDRVLSSATHYMGQNNQDDRFFYGLLQKSNLVRFMEV